MKISTSKIGSLLALGAVIALTACKSHERKVWFGNLTDGQNVESPFKVEMKAQNLVVEPASMGVTDGHGHFHIIINSSLPASGLPIAKDSLHIHYGKGQTETTLNLPVGDYTLDLVFAKGDHVPYDPQISQEVHIHVTKQNLPDTTAADSTHKAIAAPAP